jgi:transposase
MDDLTELFCRIADFCKKFEPEMYSRLLTDKQRFRRRKTQLSLSEMMTLLVLFHQLRHRQFKRFYLNYVSQYLRAEFPNLPSYSRCIELMPHCALAFAAFFQSLKGKPTGISIVDSTPLAVCDNLRIKRHRVFHGLAERGKSSTGWFFGFKLHIVINHLGKILNCRLTPGNVNDRKPLPRLLQSIVSKLYADKGYLSKSLTEALKALGVDLVTKVRKNMAPIAHSAFDKALLSKRSLVETMFDQLKNLCQIEHTRHRSPANFIVNLISGIVAYCLMPKKPSISLQSSDLLTVI